MLGATCHIVMVSITYFKNGKRGVRGGGGGGGGEETKKGFFVGKGV